MYVTPEQANIQPFASQMPSSELFTQAILIPIDQWPRPIVWRCNYVTWILQQ